MSLSDGDIESARIVVNGQSILNAPKLGSAPLILKPPKDLPKLELDVYIANYNGTTRFDRLLTIGTTCRPLAHDALHLALAEAKGGICIRRYEQAIQAIDELLPGDSASMIDEKWLQDTQERVKREADRLETELKGYKNNLIKESIRMGNEDLGGFYYEIGDYAASSKAYQRMREYCTIPKHIAEQSLKLVLVSIAQGNWVQAQSNIYRVSTVSNVRPEEKAKMDPVVAPITGLVNLATGQYRSAAQNFVKADPAYIAMDAVAGIQFNKQVLTGNDVATYAGLTALASMDRNELQSQILDNNDFRNFLELEPQIRRAVAAFCSSKFTHCLEILEAYKTDYLVDVYLQRHVEELYSEIRRKSIVQYFKPFSRVSLSVMADAFRVSEERVEEELVGMIESGMLDARLDLVDRVLVATREVQRDKVLHRSLEMAKEQENAMRLRLWRINMVNAGFELKVSKHGALEGRSVGMRRKDAAA